MNQCCSVKSLCIDPASPIQNFSSEAPDVALFIGESTGWDNSDGGYNTPSIGGTWDSSGCQFICTSTVSQADADQCAANQQLACADGTWTNPPGHPVQNFLNAQESCLSFCPDGLPFSFTVSAGTILATNQVRANEIAAAFACQNARLRRICLSSLNPSEVCIGKAYNGTITASGGLLSPSLNAWTLVAGSLPSGLKFGGSIPTFPFQVIAGPILNIVGTPTTGGSFPFTIRFTAPNGDFMTKAYTLCVVDITPHTLPDAIIGTAYSAQLTSCDTQPNQSWQVTTGALPPGLSINEETGAISGTPIGPVGNITFTVTLQDQST